jgi:hypothetical protein
LPWSTWATMAMLRRSARLIGRGLSKARRV